MDDEIHDPYDDSVSSVHSSIPAYPPSSRPPTPFSYTDSRPPTPSDAPYNVHRSQIRSQWESSHSRGGSPALSAFSNWTRSSSSSSTRLRDLEHENQCLREQLLVATAERRSYQDAYTTLAGQVALKQPASVASTVPKIIAPLKQESFPLVKFWHASDWKKFSDNEKAVSGGDEGKSGQNVAQRYIEDDQGNVVDRDRARKIRSIAHQIFFDLRNTGRTQSKWSECGLGATEWFNNEMAHQVPEMRFCSEHWKAHKLATYLYPSWHNSHGTSKPVTIKDEVVGDVPMTDVAVPGTVMNPAIKRSLEEQGPTKKKPRSERRQKKVEASPLTVQISRSTSSQSGPEATDVPVRSAVKISNPLFPSSPEVPIIPTGESIVTSSAKPGPANSSFETDIPPPSPISISEPQAPQAPVASLFGTHQASAPTAVTSELFPVHTPAASSSSLSAVTSESFPVHTPAASSLPLPAVTSSALGAATSASASSSTPAPPISSSAPIISVLSHTPILPARPVRAMANLQLPVAPQAVPAPVPSLSLGSEQVAVHTQPISTAAPVKASKIPKIPTARALCKKEWSKANPGGSNPDFQAHWTSLTGTAEGARFIAQHEALKEGARAAAT